MPDVVAKLKEQARTHARTTTAVPPWLRTVQARCELLNWFVDYLLDFSTCQLFLNEIKSDVLGALYSATLGVQKSVSLHLRSILENLLRHAYYESRPALFVARYSTNDEVARLGWATMKEEVLALPHFAFVVGKESRTSGRFDLGAELGGVYSEASSYVHGGTRTHKNLHRSVGDIEITAPQAERILALSQRFYDATIVLLVHLHVGPYCHLSPRSRRQLLAAMSVTGREQLLAALSELSMGWVRLHREQAVATAYSGPPNAVPRLIDGIHRTANGPLALIRP